jgi:TatD DNase family protein
LCSLPNLGVSNAICVGYDLPSSEKAIAIAAQYPHIYAAVGFHPENLQEYSEENIEKLKVMLQNPKVVAIGEIGMDYHWKEMPPELQKRAFERQLTLAEELDLPVIIHAREATADTLEILSRHKSVEGVLHCYSGSAETAKILIDWGFYIGFTGVLTFKNARHPVESVGVIPKERLLLETDCPYMAPVPWRGKRSCSPMIQSVAEKMAEIKGVSPQEMIDIAAENARKLFRIP